MHILEPIFHIFRDLFQILRIQNDFFQFCSVHHFLYINCSHLCNFRLLCNKDCIWSSEIEILILEVLERCVLHCSWPPLLQSGARPRNVPSPSPPHIVPQTSNNLIQRISLASKQLLINYGPKAPDDPPRDKSIKAQCRFRGMFNDWVNISLPPAEEGAAPVPPSRAVRNVSLFNSPSVLLEFNTAELKSMFDQTCLPNSAPKPTYVRPRTYTIILHFVPCSGLFDPSLEAHLREVEVENDLPVNSIVSTSWCKRPEKRSPNQKAANMFITGRIRVDDHLVTVHKNIRLPIRCIKCQEYGHTRDSCIGVE